MSWTSIHLKWLEDTKERLITVDGRTVEVWEFRPENDEEILSEWAKHFRNHYCLDCEIDGLRSGTGYSRTEYLDNLKFPDAKAKPGPSIRAGDFGEVLVADYLQYILKYWVPRTRYCDKAVRNESTKGCDIIGIKLLNDCEVSPEDILAIFESKTQFSGRKARPRLQDAVIGSTKDQVRKAESLNAAKQVLLSRGKIEEVNKLERFQNPEDNPYREISGAAVLYSTYLYDPEVIAETTTRDHPNKDNLLLVVIRGDMTMKLIDDLYRRAADEA